MLIKRRTSSGSLPDDITIHPLLKRIYLNRGINHVDALEQDLNRLLPFESMMGIHEACHRLYHALKNQQNILIIGDFDADGATSTALAVSALKLFGAKNVQFLVPNRFEYGYGLTPAIVEVAKSYHPDLIITVDNGIASIGGVRAANFLNIDVLITDHHLPGTSLPEACAIVNPNQPGCPFESKTIAGVGVIFYVMLALRRHLVNLNWFEEQHMAMPNMASLLDLVALGTVADVVGLDQNNRIMVAQGLKRIRAGQCRPGILALIKISSRDRKTIRETDLGFALAPRLNAAGRLDDMSLGINCLLAESEDIGLELAERLDLLNQERREIESEMKLQAIKALDDLSLGQTLPDALCLFDKQWHQGVIGILAGRIKDQYHRPTIALAYISDDEIKGSARSIPGLNIRDVLANIDTEHPGLIKKFGGHAMAAGLTLTLKNIDAFRDAFIEQVKLNMPSSNDRGTITTDGALEPEYFNINTALMLQEAGPWGQQFPEPVFDNQFEILEQRIVGKNHLKLSLAHPKSGEVFDAIAFNIDLDVWPNHRARFIHAVFKLDINTYQGRSRLQLLIDCMNEIKVEQDVFSMI